MANKVCRRTIGRKSRERVMVQVYPGERLRDWPDAVALEKALESVEHLLAAGSKDVSEARFRAATARVIEAVRRGLHEPSDPPRGWEDERLNALGLAARAIEATRGPEELSNDPARLRTQCAARLRTELEAWMDKHPGRVNDRAALAGAFCQSRFLLYGYGLHPSECEQAEREWSTCKKAIAAILIKDRPGLDRHGLATRIVVACERALGDRDARSLFDGERKRKERARPPADTR